jgi:DNA replication protein DnaC
MKRNKIASPMESALLKLVNKKLDVDIELEDYQKIDLFLHSESMMKDILRKFKFKDVGSIYDFSDDLPIPTDINGYDLAGNFDMFQRIGVSEKYNSVILFTSGIRHISCTFLIDNDSLKKFSKLMRSVLQQDAQHDLFRGINFKCKDGAYIEIAEPNDREMKPIDIMRKKVSKENLIFDKDSAISEVMTDISSFFKDETKRLYERMQIPHKRGIIIYGDPGNGKSAMIREIIRIVPKITKIVINPNIENITRILSMLTKSLNGQPAIIIIEDIDSLITSRNRSEFLNILDGVDIKSGIFFIGTTNYPEQIDPAFMNRSGRFDRTYRIDNPSDAVRRMFFESRKINELLGGFKVYKDSTKPVTNDSILNLCVKYSRELPMATLKEIMTSTQYTLVSNKDISIEEALKKTYDTISDVRSDHSQAHNKYKEKRQMMPNLNMGYGYTPPYITPVYKPPVQEPANGSFSRNSLGFITLQLKPKQEENVE